MKVVTIQRPTERKMLWAVSNHQNFAFFILKCSMLVIKFHGLIADSLDIVGRFIGFMDWGLNWQLEAPWIKKEESSKMEVGFAIFQNIIWL